MAREFKNIRPIFLQNRQWWGEAISSQSYSWAFIEVEVEQVAWAKPFQTWGEFHKPYIMTMIFLLREIYIF